MASYQQQLLSKFNETYHQLNEQQQIAVNNTEGPVMVIAGPGTGKTQILAARISKILLMPDNLPENILCLTYTDAGAIAMRKRLQQFIGADAYKVNIYTFHAFCNDVIQDNLSLFEKNSLDAISELENIQLFKTLIDQFQKDNPLKRYRGDVYYEINNLRQLFSTMKREGWTASFINQKIDAYIESLPLRDEYITKRATKDFKKGEVRLDKIKEEVEKKEKLRAAVNEFDHYQQLMRERNRYDFDDMINWVIKAFEENPTVLANYQERFQYILVDEYQDTSGTQNRLVQLLISYWEKPNVFVVGDDDQSIYRFQGANVENMLNFANAYEKDLITVVLTNNYRSTQPILDISKTLINNNQERLVTQIPGLSKDLKSANSKFANLTINPIIREYNSVKEEMAGITNNIVGLLANGVAPGAIAIIYKENKYGEALAQYCRLQNIPVYSKRSFNILQDPFIDKVLTILRYLNAEHDIPYGGDEMLFKILHFDFYKIAPIDIAKLTVEASTKKYTDPSSSLRRLLVDKATRPPQNLFDEGLNKNLVSTSAMLEQLIADVANVSLQQLIDNVIRNAGVLKYVMQSNEKLRLLQVLTALFDFVKAETSRNPYLNLNGFIDIIDLMAKESLPINMVEVSGNEKSVNLLTAHGSKGLEFTYVFFAGVNANAWEKKRKPNGGYILPDTVFNAAPSPLAVNEELRRLFFVALTRAEKYLYISFAKYNNEGKGLEPSMFIAEIQQVHHLPVEKISLSDDEMAIFNSLQFTAQAPEIAHIEADFIEQILSKFAMNVTALNNYLKCPLQFYYGNLIRIPSGKSEATEFGSAIHHALEQLFKKMQDGGKETFGSKADLMADFNWYMHRHRENFTKEQFARRMEYGETVLTNYYDTYVQQWNKVVAVERNIRGVVVDGVPLKGKMDKLEFDGKNINVVDYKTGNVDNALEELKGPNDKNELGGNYWRQAIFYKILIDNYPQKDWQVVSTEFDFVEPDKNKKYRKEKIVISPTDTNLVREQIVTVWNKIQAKDFYTGCGKPDCKWCNFVKNNELAIALHEMNDEANED
ncbi:ATP-dependent helicase [Ferruginibacter yonginensis]|uniref:DNA 3'-5' helicase n=1 Tax=Ferruginibacter yonginensis TaxID=1310416 RepID=A0ABV8QRL1_9BACT